MDELILPLSDWPILVVITGSRDWGESPAIWGDLDDIKDAGRMWGVVHGAARGADQVASNWAQFNDVREFRFPAQWEKHGKAAGPIRNGEMVNFAIDYARAQSLVVLVLAYPLPESRGTYDMIRKCQRVGMDVRNRGENG